MIQQLSEEENAVSYRRRILHGKIDILRAELVNRLRKKHAAGESVISGADVQRTHRHPGRQDRARRPGRRLAVHCPECGFVNAEGELLPEVRCLSRRGRRGQRHHRGLPGRRDRRAQARRPRQVSNEGATLVIRSGGGRSGEAFDVAGDRMTIGRSPEAEIFLDDVTVSRNHALLVRRRDGLYVDDLGSLNGTYVNRRRIESHKLQEATSCGWASTS